MKNVSRLKGLEKSGIAALDSIVNNFYSLSDHYKPGAVTITHGDPHLDNVFHCDEGVTFIDWEWAGIASPVRDVSFLLQDVYRADVQKYVANRYQQLITDTMLHICETDYRRDLAIWGIDTTLMMIGWELEKYFSGEEIDADIVNKINFKIQFILEQWKQLLRSMEENPFL
ncbi:hypothetical protein AV540_02805 [Brevibacillus parabrevis]|uniref:phosphotransferase family protein n=1 Tax=Brevibacillus parabrevis TaxID=54914 RepID=UPI0007AB4C6E|nr:phosphotransferase [Brevibacillus parabrevis]KZE41963.1 hypothetical protein AV540_02805 [Brevibacillus parabrevis]